MQLEAGKFYKTSGGVKMHCLGKNEFSRKDDTQPWIVIDCTDGEVNTYCEDGSYYSDGGACDYDLIAEWKDPRSHTGEVYLVELLGKTLALRGVKPLSGSSKVIGKAIVTITEGEGLAV